MLRLFDRPVFVGQILVSIGEDSISLVHRTGGFVSKVLEQKHQKFVQQSDSLLPAWQQALMHLQAMLTSLKLAPKTEFKVILASDFVRYLSLAGQQVHMNQDEKLAYVLAAYQEVYGSAADAWEIKLNDTAPSQAGIAAAVDKALLQGLSALAQKNQLVLTSVQPYLMCAYNALASQVSKANGYLAIVELKRFLLVNLQAGKCQSLRTFLLGTNWQNELKSQLEREFVMSGSSNGELYLYAPMHKGATLDGIKNTHFKRLGLSANLLSHEHFAMLEAAI